MRNSAYVEQAKGISDFPIVAGLLAVLIAIYSAAILRKGMITRASNVLSITAVVITSIIAIPTLLLFSSIVSYGYSIIYWAFVLLAWRYRSATTNTVLGLAVVCVLADALAFHGHITGSSQLGYTPAEGARYYGVGNEVMGFWIGATTYICCKLAERPKLKGVALALAIAVILALGLPGAGAKAGGFLVGLITLAAALWTRSGRAIKPGIAVIGAVGIVIVGVVALVAMGRLFGASHVTQTIGMAHSQGVGAIVSVIVRKAAMDAHLVFHSVWMLVLLVSCVSSFIALRPIWRSPDLQRTEVVALITATAASLVLNDAGVVAAALCSLSLWCSAMLLSQLIRPSTGVQSATPAT